MRILPKQRHRLIARVLALALLVAQIGAEAHAYSHLVTDQSGVPSSAQTCGKCLSFAPLTMAVGGTPYVLLTDRCEIGRVLPIAISSVPNRSPYPAFRPRAPPQLL